MQFSGGPVMTSIDKARDEDTDAEAPGLEETEEEFREQLQGERESCMLTPEPEEFPLHQ